MNRFFYILVFIIFVSGCNSSEGTYQGILIYNNEKFILRGNVEDKEYTMDKRIGIVANKAKHNVMPTHNLWSNYLDKGTELFSSKEDQSIILAKHGEEIEVFRKENSD
jgi:hypothetical protein